jgi:hypothetical protein
MLAQLKGAGVSVPLAAPLEPRRLLSVSLPSMPALASGDFNGDGSTETLTLATLTRAQFADLGFIGRGFRKGSLLMTDTLGNLVGDALPFRVRGTSPLVTVGDFNEDGNLDVVAANAGRRGLTFLAGNGDGTFDRGVAVAGAPSGITSLNSGDFNNDGTLDLLVTTNGLTVGRRRSAFADLPPIFQPRIEAPEFSGTGPGLAGLALGATLSGGGAVDDAFAPQQGNFDLVPRLDLALEAGSTGVTAEAGGAVTSLFGDILIATPVDVQPLVLFGNGDGTFSAAGSP